LAKLTSKYQLTLPKAAAEKIGLRPGDDVDCEPAGEIIRVRAKRPTPSRSVTDQLVLFDLATERQRHREHLHAPSPASERGWTRDDLYER
jgi:AbrB family looped-hinge helix DNA binding protein